MHGKEIDKHLRDLIEIIHFTEHVSAKIHGVLDEAAIYRNVAEEFARSGQYTASVLLLTDDGSHLRIAETSISGERLEAAEEAAELRLGGYRIDLNKSSIYRQVVIEAKTLQVNASDIYRELFPRQQAEQISRIIEYANRPAILTPLTRHGKIIGTLNMSSTEMAEYLIPSVSNLAQHISSALELVDEIAERKQVEESLRESEERYRTLVERSSQGIAVRQGGRFVLVNQALADQVGYTIDELLEFTREEAYGLAHADDREMIAQRSKDRDAGKTVPDSYEHRFMHKKDEVCWTQVTEADIELGGEQGRLSMYLDITERKQAEEDLQQYADELESAVERLEELDLFKSEFIQNVSHELRQPLALIRGHAELLAAGELGELDQQQQTSMDIIVRRTRMLASLVEDIVLILLAEKRALERAPVYLDQMVQTGVEDFAVVAEQQGLALETEIATGLPPVGGDAIYLRRVLDNLLGNAIKFTPRGGTISVRLEQKGDQLVLEVSDTGIGVSPDHQQRVFERFYQVDGSSRRRYGGVGLGLAVVRDLVELHGGEVGLESEVGKGSTFTVTLPIQDPD
jgi:PAS domain S-box-containing protein